MTWVSLNCNHDVDRAGSVPGRGTSCLTLRNELSAETHMLTKRETFLGRGAQVESRRVREPRRTALPPGSQPWFYGDGVHCQVDSAPVILTQGPSWWRPRRSAKMDASKEDSGRWQTRGVSSWPFLSSSDWWWLICSMLRRWLLWFLARVGGFCQCASPNSSSVEALAENLSFLPFPAPRG